MRIEVVTVCIGYDDFLATVAPYNIPHFDRWLIVTKPSDDKTREVCRRFNLDCLLTDDSGEKLKKGRLVERGLQHLSASSWRMQLDADIVLPNHFKRSLEVASIQEDTIYGADRIMIRSYEEWQKLLESGFIQTGGHDYDCRINIPYGFTIGTRWGTFETGWLPIGFFQLWHSSQDEWRGIRVKKYPEDHNSACRTDVQFTLQWDRKKRALIPEIMVIHLESEKSPKGENWDGRKSKRFGPNQIEKNVEKNEFLEE